MSYAVRSACADLKIGIHEGSEKAGGKDWGGPQDPRIALHMPDTDCDREALLDGKY